MCAATLSLLTPAAIVFAGLTLPAASAQDGGQAESSVLGYWETPEAESVVELRRCPSQPAKLCGHVEWLSEGEPRTDVENPDPELRGREIVGLQFLSGFEREEEGVWSGGEVYNPDDGRTYSGEIRQAGPDTLELEGCALMIFCKTQEWERVTADDPRLAGAGGSSGR